MIEKMQYVNIMGPVGDIDRAAEKYFIHYEIQLENAVASIQQDEEVSAFNSGNSYSPLLEKANKFARIMDAQAWGGVSENIAIDEAVDIIRRAAEYYDKQMKTAEEAAKKREEVERAIEILEPFSGLVFDLSAARSMTFVTGKFGKMPIESFKQFEAFLYKDPQLLFVEASRNDKTVWGAYFAPKSIVDKADSIFAAFHFEPVILPQKAGLVNIDGPPSLALAALKEYHTGLGSLISDIERAAMEEETLSKETGITKRQIAAARQKLEIFSHCFDIRKYAAIANDDFYVLVGWMPKKEARRFANDVADDDKVFFTEAKEDEPLPLSSVPPTKMQNPSIVRPFEMFVNMYGLPSYNEIDPTPFVALTYTFLFGVMFGDVGQGLLLSFIGFLLWHLKKLTLGKIMATIGISSAFFGIVFGSFFGFEFHPLWLKPSEPDNIATVLIYAIVFGAFIIVVSMLINMLNAVKKKAIRHIIFDVNGVAGAVFYVSLLLAAANVLLNGTLVPVWVIILFIVLPILAVGFREPIMNIIEKRGKIIEGGIVMFLFETIIELFEVVLSFFTNTVSFVRVGAFALSHACMMGVVMMLAGEASGSPNPIVIVFGNMLVIVLEGLIVGIQVLRLEFYEMFSRFYSGTGRAFVSYGKRT